MSEEQQPLLSAKKQRAIHKTRSDKGKRRKPAPSEREAWHNYFRELPEREQAIEIGYLTALMDMQDEQQEITGLVGPVTIPFDVEAL